jgi:hypothetical protein
MLESHEQVPLGGPNIFNTYNWTTEVTEIIAPLIVGFENESTKENKQNDNTVSKE